MFEEMTWLPPSSKHPPPASAAKADADGDSGDGSGDATADDAEEDGAQVDRDGVSQKDWVSSPLGSSLPLPCSPSSATRCARGSLSICCSTRRASSPRRVLSLFRLFSIYGILPFKDTKHGRTWEQYNDGSLMRRWLVLGRINKPRCCAYGSEKPRFSTFMDHKRSISTRCSGRERANGARGSHHCIVPKFARFSCL